MDEKTCSYYYTTDTSMRAPGGAFTPAAYLRLVETALEAHMTVLQLDVPRLVREFGVTWVLLSISFEMLRAVGPNERVCVKTWATYRKGAVYRREVQLLGDDGAVIANAAAFYALLDVRARRICMDKSVMAAIDLPDGGTLLTAGSRTQFDPAGFTPVETRRVRPSWLDAIGHMNNSRYAELAFDALTADERARMGALSRLEFYFMSELRQADAVQILRCAQENGASVAGVREADGKASFLVKFCFGAQQTSGDTIIRTA